MDDLNGAFAFFPPPAEWQERVARKWSLAEDPIYGLPDLSPIDISPVTYSEDHDITL